MATVVGKLDCESEEEGKVILPWVGVLNSYGVVEAWDATAMF